MLTGRVIEIPSVCFGNTTAEKRVAIEIENWRKCSRVLLLHSNAS
jgi:hypothetical protein